MESLETKREGPKFHSCRKILFSFLFLKTSQKNNNNKTTTLNSHLAQVCASFHRDVQNSMFTDKLDQLTKPALSC